MMDDRGKTGTKKHIMSRINLVHVAHVSDKGGNKKRQMLMLLN